MNEKCNRKRWTLNEVEKLKTYIKKQSELLLSNFYENIIEGKMKIRKPPGFFIEMASFLKMTPKQCKSKFQKSEKEIYTNYLGVPSDYYEVFTCLRLKNFFIKQTLNQNLKNSFKNGKFFKKSVTKGKQNKLNNKLKRKKSEFSEDNTYYSKSQQKSEKSRNKKLFMIRKKIIKEYKANTQRDCKIEERNLEIIFVNFKILFQNKMKMRQLIGTLIVLSFNQRF